MGKSKRGGIPPKKNGRSAPPHRISPEYSVVVPAFNEEDVIGVCHAELRGVMDKTGRPYELIFVNDGSTDRTLSILRTIAGHDRRVKVIDLSRNFGHQAAISAGLDRTRGRAVIIIDADLQDPPAVIPEMIAQWKLGFEVVYGRRVKRENESVFKRLSAWLFYRFLRALSGVPIPADAGDFRLLDRKVRNALVSMPERHRFLRGLVSWTGFRQTAVAYRRRKRRAGKSKYPLWKMVGFALDGVTSLSRRPLRLATLLGLLISAAGFVYLAYSLLRFLTGRAVEGWMSLVALLIIFNGALFLLVGILGEYVGRIYDEVKARPLYLVSETIGFSKDAKQKNNRRRG
jgi:glycosyltransferase involved in cell wall biosynthesis